MLNISSNLVLRKIVSVALFRATRKNAENQFLFTDKMKQILTINQNDYNSLDVYFNIIKELA